MSKKPIVLLQGDIVSSRRRRTVCLKVTLMQKILLIVVRQLEEIRDLWSKIHSQHPFRPTGFSIIDHLIQHPDAYITPKQYKFKSMPSAGDLLEDLQFHKKLFYSVSSEFAEDATFAKFMQGWVDMGDARDPSIHPPYCAFDVRCNCMVDVPVEFQSGGVLVCRTGENDTMEWSFVMTAASTSHDRIWTKVGCVGPS
jgi:hypothetical protein